MKKTQLLIDADGFIFSTSIALQEPHPFDPDGDPICDVDKAITVLAGRYEELKRKFNADEMLMFLSCHREDGHRRTMVDETYKANRNDKKSPVALKALREYTEKNYKVIQEPNLEADDLIGIYATEPQKEWDRIIISFDKDVTGLPGKTYNPRRDESRKVTKATSLKFFLFQMLMGDSADGYKGFKRVGKVKAQKFVNGLKALANPWDEILELGASCGHDEEYVLKQAQMAYILRHGDYDFKTKEVTLFTPERIGDLL